MLKIWNDYDRESENPPRTGHRPLGRTADAGLAAAAVDDPLGRAPQGGGRRGRQRRALVRRRSVRTLWADPRGICQLATVDRPQRHARTARDAHPALSRPLRAPTAFLKGAGRSEEHTSELQTTMRSSYAVLCLKKKK